MPKDEAGTKKRACHPVSTRSTTFRNEDAYSALRGHRHLLAQRRFGLGGEEGPLPDELPGGGVGLELAAGVGAAEP